MDQVEQLKAELAATRRALGELRLQYDIASTMDPVTGLLNGNGVFDVVDEASARQARTSEPFALLLISVPGLDIVREAYGDRLFVEAVRDVGALVGASLRDMDRVGRIDDSCFLCVLPWMSEEGLAPLRLRLSRVVSSLGDSFVPEFASVAATPFAPVDADDLLTVLATATPRPASP